MKLQALAALLSLLAVTNATNINNRHANIAHKRQEASATASGSASASAAASSGAATSAAASGAASAPAATSDVGLTSTPSPTATDVPALVSISSGMSSGTTWAPTTTYSPGATAPVSGAPALPSAFVFQQGEWPAQDVVPPTDTDEVKQWLKELDGFTIPDISTTDGTCAGSPDAVADAEARGWWTCGGYTRATDITACDEKMHWGVSFDDGPAMYTGQVLKYLDENSLQATFFVVGSRVIERPGILLEEYMGGHDISVHTWSHRPLTSLTTEQVVAELGWTRKAIQAVLGVTPTTMRPPYGDMDDRVRAIALAMGMVPIIWSRGSNGESFDTNDWKVAGGVVSAPESYMAFQNILGNATELDTGFIVLSHDLYEESVDMNVGYYLPAALNYDPPMTLESISQCVGIPATNMYLESNQNTSFPYTNHTTGTDVNGDGSVDNSTTAAGQSDTAGNGASASMSVVGLAHYSVVAAGLAVLGFL
ncbi:carbohydrate esterase family 4 protein [Schizophyllum amplum]|uniref:chitin deacetylase n=1 Tax=Schizophyllum amplum TaxID=97359 RepID=A0A550CL05_9AGAR|nr:carbohydrate esterase family 4 protein [Auriculariopsis ampla]